MSSDYPTTESLTQIETFAGLPDTLDALLTLLDATWIHDYGYLIREGPKLVLITGGWSGNEEIISALQMTAFWPLYWMASKRGGYFEFRLDGTI